MKNAKYIYFIELLKYVQTLNEFSFARVFLFENIILLSLTLSQLENNNKNMWQQMSNQRCGDICNSYKNQRKTTFFENRSEYQLGYQNEINFTHHCSGVRRSGIRTKRTATEQTPTTTSTSLEFGGFRMGRG